MFFVLGWSWQILRTHHRLSDQLESILDPLEEKGVVPIRHEEIVIKCAIFDAEPHFSHIINGMMLKFKLVYQEILLSRLDISVAPKRLNFKLGTLLQRIE